MWFRIVGLENDAPILVCNPETIDQVIEKGRREVKIKL